MIPLFLRYESFCNFGTPSVIKIPDWNVETSTIHDIFQSTSKEVAYTIWKYICCRLPNVNEIYPTENIYLAH